MAFISFRPRPKGVQYQLPEPTFEEKLQHWRNEGYEVRTEPFTDLDALGLGPGEETEVTAFGDKRRVFIKRPEAAA